MNLSESIYNYAIYYYIQVINVTYLKCLYILVCKGNPFSSVPILGSYLQVPPTYLVASKTVNSIPSSFKYLAEVMPAIPAPITQTR